MFFMIKYHFIFFSCLLTTVQLNEIQNVQIYPEVIEEITPPNVTYSELLPKPVEISVREINSIDKDFQRDDRNTNYYFFNRSDQNASSELSQHNKRKHLIDYRKAYRLRYNPDFHTKYPKHFKNITNDVAYFDNVMESTVTNEVTIDGDLLMVAENSNLTKPIRRQSLQTTIKEIRNHLEKLFILGQNGTTKENKLIQDALSPPSKRFLNLFHVVQFENAQCMSNSYPLRQMEGTCYYKTQCAELGGIEMGLCAAGFGVCCVFKINCNGISHHNVTYFESPKFPLSTADKLDCHAAIEIIPGVKQILVEFLLFEMNPPNKGDCIDDQFFIIGQNPNQKLPTICGLNSGQHMYLNVDNSPDMIIHLNVFTKISSPRIFSIKITQIRDNLAPENCLQYYRGINGFVNTFNYDNFSTIVQIRRPSYFNNLNYAICIKRAPGYCQITYSNELNDEQFAFDLLNVDNEGMDLVPPNQAGAEVFNCADDHIAINGIRLCGQRFNDGAISEDYTKNTPVTDTSGGPIILPFKTNESTVGRGFKLFYTQNVC